jgi:predicted acylesterase/phospholipase RssA
MRNRQDDKPLRLANEPGCAIVLAGALGQGAFEAGALQWIAQRGYRPCAFIGTSSGALNALGMAHGVVRGESEKAAANLARAWVEQGSLPHLLKSSWNVAQLLARRGVLDQRGLYDMMRTWAPPLSEAQIARAPSLRLSIVVSPLQGKPMLVRGTPHRTYEHVEHFAISDFSAQGMERVYQFVAASSAFPGLFAPVELPLLGPCVDGGAVNNTPIASADEAGEPIFLICAAPADAPAPAPLRGLGLLTQFINILTQERLVRDLARVPETRRVVEIRPATPLPGNGLSALLSRRERQQAVELGYACARDVLTRFERERVLSHVE